MTLEKPNHVGTESNGSKRQRELSFFFKIKSNESA